MSYDNPRIGLSDNLLDIVTKMSDGNPGAVNVMMNMLKKAEAIDPDAMLGGIGAIMSLDTHDIYGSRIWRFFKDVSGQSLVTMLGLMRAVQLGYLRESQLSVAIDGAPMPEGWVEESLAKVRDRLPAFAAADFEAAHADQG